MRLHWAERGGPTARVPTKRGFGTTLIEESAKGEGGTARMTIDVEGLSWDIVLPLPELAGPFLEQPNSPPTRKDLEIVQTISAKLAGKRFLIVEDEPLVALLQADTLTDEGAEIIASVASVKEALESIVRAHVDAALLDGNLRGHPVDEVAAALTRKNVPFLFVSGFGTTSLPPSFRDVALLSKPFTQEELIEAASRLIEKNPASLALRKIQSQDRSLKRATIGLWPCLAPISGSILIVPAPG